MDITDALRSYVQDKVEHAMEEFPRVESVHVILAVEKYRRIAEIVIQAANHIRVEAKEESDDMYVSVDAAVEKVSRQLRKLRDKVQDHKRESLAEIELGVQAAEQ
jgi:putative sigma-54 modulation protein